MKPETEKKDSQLVAALREGVGVVQMILFKEMRNDLIKRRADLEKSELSMLAGSITNEVFGTQNPEEKFVIFRKQNKGTIEQELLALKENHPFLCRHITDALRTQVLCDHQEGVDSGETMVHAKEFGFLLEEREVPLPSTFMTIIRDLGKQHNLIVPPVQITPAQDSSIVH